MTSIHPAIRYLRAVTLPGWLLLLGAALLAVLFARGALTLQYHWQWHNIP